MATKTTTDTPKKTTTKKATKTQQERLSDFLLELEAPVKDTDAYKYKYATLPQVLDIIKAGCKKHGFYIMQLSKHYCEMGNQMEWVLQSGLFDVETGDQVLADTRPLFYGQNAQTNGSFETYSRRYALLTMLGLSAIDDDGKATVDPVSSTKRDEALQVYQEAQGIGVSKEELDNIIGAYVERHGGNSKLITDDEYDDCILAFRTLIEQKNSNIMGVM